MAREALRLRDTSASRGLRPTPGSADEFNSALRSDYTFVDAPLGVEETFLNSDVIGYDSVILSFLPSDVIARNPYVPYGNPTAFCITRSPAGYPTTDLDGVKIATFDFSSPATVTTKALTTNVVTITTLLAHGFTVGQTVVVSINDVVFDGTFVIASTPLTTTFTYAKTNANVGSTAATGYAYVYGGVTPLPTDQRALVTDDGLRSGSFYYYGLFAKYVNLGNIYWLRVARSEQLIPINFGYKTKTWEGIPEYYRRLDTERVGSYAQDGVLKRYMNTYGYEVDLQRTWALTVGDVWDVARLNSRLLPYLGRNVLGLSDEAVVGDKRYRKLLANIMYLRKLSGTKDGIEGYLAALTGYRTIVYTGKNLYLENDSAEARLTVGQWQTATVNVNASRIVSAGEAGGPGNTVPYLRYTNSTGGAATALPRYGGATFDPKVAIPVTAAHQYRHTFFVRDSEVSKNITPLFDWYDQFGAFISTTTDSPIGMTTSWAAVASSWVTAPALSVYMIPRFSSTTMSNAATINLWRLMITDRSWVPLGIPSAIGVDPTVTYETARLVYINLYPQRTNFAINADFRNNVAFPACGWTATDPASYELLPTAYAQYSYLAAKTITNKQRTTNVSTITTATIHNLIVGNNVTVACNDATFNGTFTVASTPTTTTFTYAQVLADVVSAAATGTVVGPEIDYADLLAGYDTLLNLTTVTFDTTNKWMTLTPTSGVAPFLAQASSQYFPVVFKAAYSARVEAQSSAAAGTNLLLRFKWYTAQSAGSEIVGTSASSQLFLLPTADWRSCTISNVQAPANALFGRVVIETTNPTVTNTARVRKAIIEDNTVPGPWFDGRETDGAFGDFRFTGTADQSFSAYYMNFNAVLNGLSSSDRVRTVLPALIPPERDYQLMTVLNGLL